MAHSNKRDFVLGTATLFSSKPMQTGCWEESGRSGNSLSKWDMFSSTLCMHTR